MRQFQSISLLLTVLVSLSVTSLFASTWNKLTRLEISETIQVPGATLPPGKYVVRLANSASNRHIVQFFNEDQSKIYSTVLAVPNSRLNHEVTGDTELVFYETTGNTPPALRAWFYPGDSVGQEFVYPKSESGILTGRSGRNVPTMDDETARTLRLRESTDQAPDFDQRTRIYFWTPAGKEVTQAEAEADNLKRDSDKSWREKQQRYRGFGRFNNQSRMSPTITVTRGVMVPANISQRKMEIHNVMDRIDDHSQAFAKDFKEALQSSTIPIGDRDELKRMADRLETNVGKLKEEYKNDKFDSAHEELRRALETGASVNRFMLRSEFARTEKLWDTIRQDLNTLAALHTIPVIEVYTFTAPRAQRR